MTFAEPSWMRIRRSDNSLVAWLLARYRASPDHRTKLRLWNWLYAIARRPEVFVHYAGGARLRLDLNDLVQATIAEHGFYEPEVWEALAEFATGNDVLWDIGGHVGGVAIRAALNPSVRRVHCFEPNPRTAARLLENLKLNPQLPVTHHPVALGDKDETRQLHFGESKNIGLASVVLKPTGDSVPVECATADGLIAAGKAEPPTLMKIDVEGFELQVLVGAKRLLSSGAVKAIVFEAEADAAGRMEADAVSALLTSFGYEIRHLQRPDGLSTRENYLAVLSRSSGTR